MKAQVLHFDGDAFGDACDDDDDNENKYARKSHHEGFHF